MCANNKQFLDELEREGGEASEPEQESAEKPQRIEVPAFAPEELENDLEPAFSGV